MGMKILHTADWHIGSHKGPEKDGVNLRAEDTLKCLEAMVKVAEREAPDLVLVSGDIFDRAETWQMRSHKEVMQARKIILELSKVANHVIVMRGTPNHDSYGAFEELKGHFEFVDNVSIATEINVIELEESSIAVLPGFDRDVFRTACPGLSKEEENEAISSNLGNIISGLRALCTPGKTSILMSHYTVPGCNMESGQTQFLTQFEPIIPIDTLNAADFDIVALGHIHRPQQVPYVRECFYSGAINMLNFNDEGQERGFWIHEEMPFGWRHEFFKTPYREFMTIRLNDNDIAMINAGQTDAVGMQNWKGRIQDKIVRVIYDCSLENKKALNTAMLAKELMKDGAFYVSDFIADNIMEVANRQDLNNATDPEENLVRWLNEKGIFDDEKIQELVLKARPIIAKAEANESTLAAFGVFEPVEISVRNYRNYREEIFNFENISFCTINGKNGAGKSSLFMDAIIDCLYEEPREGELTGWISSDEKARSGSIMFTFRIGDKIYRVTRTRSKSKKGTLNLAELVDGEWVGRSKEKYRDTQEEIIKVLGMDSLTFKSCALIMQDQYGLFVQAKKEERMSILSNLLGLGIYRSMEELVRTELGNLRRDIAGNNRAIKIYTYSMEEYGKPEEEIEVYEEKLENTAMALSDLQKQKEDKSLLLRIQKEAEERRNKVLASVNTLEQKKAATEQNIKLHEATISTCDYALAEESEITQKVEQYNKLVERDKELSSAKATYLAKREEYERVHKELIAEQTRFNNLTLELQTKKDELRQLSNSDNDEEVRQKAFEYEMAKKELDEAYQSETQYRAVEREFSFATAEKSSVIASYEAVKKGMESKLEEYKKQAELLDTVECVDIANAKCGFLANAINAKKMVDDYPAFMGQSYKEHLEKLKPYEDKIAALESELSSMPYDKDKVSVLMDKCRALKPYVAKLQELNERESRIALIRAGIDGVMSLIISKAMEFKTYHTTYCNSMFAWINALRKASTISNITYGSAIPEKYQSEVLKYYMNLEV